MKHRNQNGFTLVEMLGALTILFIVGGIVFAVLNNGLQFFRIESTRINVGQEANIIANQLTTFYQEHGDFEVVHQSDGSLMIASGEEIRVYSIPGHIITVDFTESQTNRFNKRNITIQVTGEQEFTLNTVVSRLRDESID